MERTATVVSEDPTPAALWMRWSEERDSDISSLMRTIIYEEIYPFKIEIRDYVRFSLPKTLPHKLCPDQVYPWNLKEFNNQY